MKYNELNGTAKFFHAWQCVPVRVIKVEGKEWNSPKSST